MNANHSFVALEAALSELGRTATYPPMTDLSQRILGTVAQRDLPRMVPRMRVGQLVLPRTLVPRVVLMALLALVLVAGAAAAYIAIQGWLATGPRGIQFSDEFTFAEVYRDGGEPIEPGPLPVSTYYPDFAIDQNGSAIYAVRMPAYPEQAASLVRLTGLDAPALQSEPILDFADLAKPELWDPGLDLSTADIGALLFAEDTIAVAPDGQVFLAAGAYGRERVPLPHAEEMETELRASWPDLTAEEVSRITTRQPLLAASLIVLREDGSQQRVLTVAQLVEAGLVPETEGDIYISVVTSAANRLWLKAVSSGPETSSMSVFEVIDPDRDGDWADRIILPLMLPDDVPWPSPPPLPGEGAQQWLDQALVAEVSSNQVDRTHSVLLPMLSTAGEYRIYRLADSDNDGDLRGTGDAELIFSAQPGLSDARGPSVASRVVVDGGLEVLRELLVSGVTGPSRIARVDHRGQVKDIARALPIGPEDIEAAPNGDIFVMVQEPSTNETAPSFVVYRLSPVPADQAAQARPSPSATVGLASPVASPVAGGPITPGVPRIAYMFWAVGEQEETSRIMVVGADGSGPTELVPGDHNSDFCQSADRSLMAFWSDEEVPNEPFPYVANIDGTGRRQISEDVGAFFCGFSAESILVKGRAASAPIVRHDLETGEQTELVSDADANRVQADPSGRRYLFVSGLEATNPPRGAESLEVIDAESGGRLVLDGPLAEDRMFAAMSWAPDGGLIAYATGPRPIEGSFDPVDQVEVFVAEPAGGEARLVHSFEGRIPQLAFSADGRRLLVSVGPTSEAPGPVTIVDLSTGDLNMPADVATWAGWHPDDAMRFAYATKDQLFLASVDGAAEELARAPADGICPDCETEGAPAGEWGWGPWIGWSPDGRYIGLPDFAPVLAVVDLESGELRILTGDVGTDAFVFGGRWLD